MGAHCVCFSGCLYKRLYRISLAWAAHDVSEMRISCFNVMHSHYNISIDSIKYIHIDQVWSLISISSFLSLYFLHSHSFTRFVCVAVVSISLSPNWMHLNVQLYSILTSDAEQTIKHNTICQICIWMTFNECEQASACVCMCAFDSVKCMDMNCMLALCDNRQDMHTLIAHHLCIL